MKMKPIWSLALSGLLLLLGGCSGDDHQDLRAWMNEEAQSMRGRVQALPKMQEMAVVDYEVSGQVDPFQASRLDPEKRDGGGKKPDTNRRREPLEAYPVESLKMVGMMMMAGKPVALIQADRTVHQIRVGNYLGQNFGRVTKITENDITLAELVEDANGDWTERTSTMQLQEQETKK